MTISIYTDDIDSVPETMREHYTKQKDGGYVLAATAGGGYSIEKVGGLKSALSAARAEAKDATSKLAAFTLDDGEMLDADTARAAIDKLAALGSDADVEAKVASTG